MTLPDLANLRLIASDKAQHDGFLIRYAESLALIDTIRASSRKVSGQGPAPAAEAIWCVQASVFDNGAKKGNPRTTSRYKLAWAIWIADPRDPSTGKWRGSDWSAICALKALSMSPKARDPRPVAMRAIEEKASANLLNPVTPNDVLAISQMCEMWPERSGFILSQTGDGTRYLNEHFATAEIEGFAGLMLITPGYLIEMPPCSALDSSKERLKGKCVAQSRWSPRPEFSRWISGAGSLTLR